MELDLINITLIIGALLIIIDITIGTLYLSLFGGVAITVSTLFFFNAIEYNLSNYLITLLITSLIFFIAGWKPLQNLNNKNQHKHWMGGDLSGYSWNISTDLKINESTDERIMGTQWKVFNVDENNIKANEEVVVVEASVGKLKIQKRKEQQ